MKTLYEKDIKLTFIVENFLEEKNNLICNEISLKLTSNVNHDKILEIVKKGEDKSSAWRIYNNQ